MMGEFLITDKLSLAKLLKAKQQENRCVSNLG